MKALRALASLVLTAWALVAAAAPSAPPASLSVYSEQGQPFGFVLDGRVLTQPLARQVRVGLLLPGRHWVDVSIPAPFGPPLHLRTTLWLQPGFDNGYVLVLRRGGPQLRPLAPGSVPGPGYGGQYPPAGGAPGQYPAPYPPQGQYDSPGSYDNNAPGPAYPNGNNYPGQPAPGTYPDGSGAGQPTGPSNYPGGTGYPANPNPGYPANPGGSYPATPSPGYPSAPDGGGYYPGSAPYAQPLSPADFDGLRQAISQQTFDDERLGIAKQALSQSTVRAEELATLIRLLSADRARIALAEFGYAHLADPQNFYRVYDALQFRSSIREVQQALGLPQD